MRRGEQMITPYGKDNASLMLGIGGCLILFGLTPIGMIGRVIAIAFGILVVAFTLWFFRDPERRMSSEAAADKRLVVAPADGTVTEVVNVGVVGELGVEAVQISIFLSPLNLHVNRIPFSGTVVEARYMPG